jgi:2,5-diketo-D-gluconate reductase A
MGKQHSIPELPLNSGVSIPQFGVGAFLLPPSQTEKLILSALEVGYRHIDTAAMYENEVEIGRAINRSQIARQDIYLTTKVRNSDHGFQSTKRAFAQSLVDLQTDYLDLYLIHWPAPGRGLFEETWSAMIELQGEGLVNSIGVCNFEPVHLEAIMAVGATPAVNQIELHPAFQQKKLREFHSKHAIVTQAWGPLGQSKYSLASLPHLEKIAGRHGKSVHQVTLRWHVQLGNVIFPKTLHEERLRENMDIFDFELSDIEMDQIAGLDVNFRLGNNPFFRN